MTDQIVMSVPKELEHLVHRLESRCQVFREQLGAVMLDLLHGDPKAGDPRAQNARIALAEARAALGELAQRLPKENDVIGLSKYEVLLDQADEVMQALEGGNFRVVRTET